MTEAEQYRLFWVAILSRAAADAHGCSCTPLEKWKAQQWFKADSRDFQEVCANAGFHPQTVREAMLSRIEVMEPKKSAKTFGTLGHEAMTA